MNQSPKELFSDEGVCRTGPATQGLLIKTLLFFSQVLGKRCMEPRSSIKSETLRPGILVLVLTRTESGRGPRLAGKV